MGFGQRWKAISERPTTGAATNGLEPRRLPPSPPTGTSTPSAATTPRSRPAHPKVQAEESGEKQRAVPEHSAWLSQRKKGYCVRRSTRGGCRGHHHRPQQQQRQLQGNRRGESTVSSVRTQLDLLEQLTSGSEYESAEDPYTPSVRDQLTDLADGRVGDFNIPLGKKLIVSINSLTISQRRNIKRQAYLNEVSQRNDTRFFATVGAFVLLPPAIILAVAILTGYVQLSP